MLCKGGMNRNINEAIIEVRLKIRDIKGRENDNGIDETVWKVRVVKFSTVCYGT